MAATYGVATLYVLADTGDKVLRAYKRNEGDEKRTIRTVYAGSDVLLWQMLASVIIPGFTINRICWATYKVLKETTKIHKNPRNYIVTAVGLTAIPFIIHPIDSLVDKILDNTIRKFAP